MLNNRHSEKGGGYNGGGEPRGLTLYSTLPDLETVVGVVVVKSGQFSVVVVVDVVVIDTLFLKIPWHCLHLRWYVRPLLDESHRIELCASRSRTSDVPISTVTFQKYIYQPVKLEMMLTNLRDRVEKYRGAEGMRL